jgi:outer membrane protein
MCISTGITVFLVLGKDEKKIAVIDAVRLFNEFNLKKELEAKDKSGLERLGKQIDSISSQLKIAQASKNTQEEQRLGYLYEYMKNGLEKEFEKSNQMINEQVWKRLNKIIDEYGKKKGYRLIIGANGMGTVLYSDNYYDVTNEAVAFANKKYEEGN